MLYTFAHNVGIKLSYTAWLFLIGFVLEGVLPRAGEGGGIRHTVLNCICGVFFISCWMLASTATQQFYQENSVRALVSIFPPDRNWVIAFAEAFSIATLKDFFYYWFHRLQHSSKWLWAEHKLHHSDEYLSVTTNLRHHWLEMPLTFLFVYIPASLLFSSPPLITFPLAVVITGMLSYFIHLNVRVGFGPLSWLLASPQSHRIHHSRLRHHYDKNFAQFFPLWDVMFGTYYHPQKDEYPPSGLASGPPVDTVGLALMLPFIEWRRMLVSRRKGSPDERNNIGR